MSSTLLSILIATVAVSLISLIGIWTIAINQKRLDRVLILLVALSAGSLMGGAFLHLLPETITLGGGEGMFLYVLGSFIAFFFIERVLHWRHCHHNHCEVHTLGMMNLIGDSIHNAIDGLVIAAAFVASPALGVSTTLAVILHEIPQEIGDFGVLVYAGYSRTKALLMNLFTALTAVIGGIAGYFFASASDRFLLALLPIAAGGFLYIAGSDLLPELRKERTGGKIAVSFTVFLAGIGLMLAMRLIGAGE